MVRISVIDRYDLKTIIYYLLERMYLKNYGGLGKFN